MLKNHRDHCHDDDDAALLFSNSYFLFDRARTAHSFPSSSSYSLVVQEHKPQTIWRWGGKRRMANRGGREDHSHEG